MCINITIVTLIIFSSTLPPCTSLIIKSQFISLANPTTPLSTNAYILTPICLGTVYSQRNCFPLVLDINNKHTVIFSHTVHPQGAPLSSSILNVTHTEYTICRSDTIINSDVCYSSIFFDSAHVLLDSKLFIASSVNIDVSHTNYLGYLSFGCSEVLGEHDSFLQQLKTQNITSSRNFGYTFTSQTEVNVFIDEHITEHERYAFCKPGMRIGLIEANMYCRMDVLSYGPSRKEIRTSRAMHVLFSTRTEYMQACSEGNDIFGVYITASNNNCYVSEDTRKGKYVTCNKDVNIHRLPDVYFGISGSEFELAMKAVDVFDAATGVSRLYVKDYCNYWVLDMNVLKRYDMYVDYEQSLIGFRENFVFEKGPLGAAGATATYKLISAFKLNIYIIIFGLIIISITTGITKHDAHS